jgi:signal transduction histidine kinase
VATLLVIQGPDQGTTYELDGGDVLTIGRDASNAVRLNDTEVSRRHAEFRRQGDRCLLVDLGSSNGTFVDGKPATRVELRGGEEVQIGRTVMLYKSPVRGGSASNLAEHINMIVASRPGESSNIVKSISHAEGSRYLSRPAEAGSPWLTRQLANLQVLYSTTLAISRTLDLEQLLERILELIFEWVEADRGCILMRDPETGEFLPKTVHYRQGVKTDEKIAISRTILEYAIEQGDGVLTSDARQDARFSPAQSIVQQGIREAICVPMQGRHDMVGVIYIDISTPPERLILEGRSRPRFTEEHLKLMIAIAHQTALAVEETRYYQAMLQAERLAAVGQTIATLSHHIKNILQGIRGGSYLIDMGLNEHDEPTVRQGWNIVEKNQTKIYNLVMDMLTFSKEREPAMLQADLNQVVAEVVELMQPRAGELGATLVAEPDRAMPSLTFDPEGIHRAVLNIVTNALDAVEGKPEGRVVVRTQYDPDAKLARVVVEDNGVGIPPDQIENIFNIFTSNKGGRGTGLGLSVSRKIIREHGGTIRVESDPGSGSRFLLELPLLPAGQSGEMARETSV